MAPLKISLLVSLLSAAVTATTFSLVARSRSQEAAELRLSNVQMQIKADQRRLAAKTTSSSDDRSVAAPTSSTRVADNRPPVPAKSFATDYRNEGQATPQAALQTFAWACDRGDTEMVARLICFDHTGRGKAEAYLTSLPADARAQWHTTEEMAASLLTSENINFPNPESRVLELATAETIGDDRIVLHLPGATLPKQRTEFQKTETGWKRGITEAVVDDFIAHAKAGVTAPP
jgi:type II secretory pathway pseudopilin PulG